MFTNRWFLETGPHYVALVGLIFLVLRSVRQMIGESSLFIELIIVLIVSFSYVRTVRALNIAPRSWMDDEK
jgi:hypothetical protein